MTKEGEVGIELNGQKNWIEGEGDHDLIHEKIKDVLNVVSGYNIDHKGQDVVKESSYAREWNQNLYHTI